MRILVVATVASVLWASVGHAAAPPAALFPFAIDDTSAMAGTPAAAADQARLPRLDAQLRDLLAGTGRISPVDIAPVATAAAQLNFRSCNGCAVDLAQKLGARLSVIGWVQKVSQLILNMTVVIQSVPDGRVVHAASVDLRGDTDESFSRGLRFLVENELFR